ncbi:phage head spike fiber domain-containing protein [Fibrella forsythiae]|uniref:CBM-cenC domain-containing protein n=1 Tax=Fibrella forsythiae TaxID=2817061 RepID=A0ABS3JAF2_9BACT|nr:hypothetical protein [Fibrella forsythiae]MBO0946961.1 hypothetical protein [Fibrella forsythiae]
MKKLLFLWLLITAAPFLAPESSHVQVTAQMTVRSNMSQFTPSLNLDFMQGVMPAGLTFTRSGTATRVNEQGRIETVAANVPRFDYDPNSVVYSGQNLARGSQAIHNAQATLNNGWTGDNTEGFSLNAEVAPDGTTTASVAILASKRAIMEIPSAVNPGNGLFTISAYAKNSAGGTIVLNLKNAGSDVIITTQTFTLTGSWQRFSVNGTTSGTNPGVRLEIANVPLNTSVWGAQINQGSILLPYTANLSNSVGIAGTQTATVLRGLLIEEGRTNVTLNSLLPDLWNKGANAVKTASQAIAPDGSLVPSYANTVGANSTVTTTAASALALNTTYTRSAYVKSLAGDAARRWVLESAVGDPGTGTQYAVSRFNLSTGVITNGPNVVSASLVNCGNGWYRCIQTFTTLSGGSPSANQHYIADYGSSTVAGTFAVWGAQCELGTFAASVIPTTTAAVTRGADNCTMPTLGWYNSNEGTFVSRFNVDYGGVDCRPLAVSDGTNNNRMVIQRNPANQLVTFGVSQGVGINFSNIGANGLVSGIITGAITYRVNDYRAAVNGTLLPVATNTAAPPVGITTLSLNTSGGRFWHNKIAYWPKRVGTPYFQIASN